MHACFQWYIEQHMRNIVNPAKAMQTLRTHAQRTHSLDR